MILEKLKRIVLGEDFSEEYGRIYIYENIIDLRHKLVFFNIIASIVGIVYITFKYLTLGQAMGAEDYSWIIVTATFAAVVFSIIFFVLTKKYEQGNNIIAAFIIVFFLTAAAISTWAAVFQSGISLTNPLIFLFVLILSAILLCFDMIVNFIVLTVQELIYVVTLLVLSDKVKFLTESRDSIINSIFVLILSYYILYLINSIKRKNFALGESIKEKAGLLENTINVDPLTGIMNRRAFDRYLPTELDRCKKGKLIFAVMIVDVDDFTVYNDSFGLLQGDYCLIKIANAIQESLSRSTDKLFRFNTNQFALIFPGANAFGCEVVATRILNVIRDLKIENEDGPYEIITVSIGVFTESMSPKTKIGGAEIMSLATKALEKAKDSGKNTFAIHDNTRYKS